MEEQKDSTVRPDSMSEQMEASDSLQNAHLTVRVEVGAGTRLHLTLDAQSPEGNALEKQTVVIENPALRRPDDRVVGMPAKLTIRRPLKDRIRAFPQGVFAAWPALLLAASLVLYLPIRLIALPEFPIFFFTDEAVQTVRAADLVRDGFRGHSGELLPTYFQNGPQYNLGVSVYLQVLPYLWFGKSVFVTRATSVLITLLAALAVGLTLKNIFRSRAAWAGVLVLSVTPTWFLHSRTAFETVIATSFYALFLYFYLRYRNGRSWALYAATLLAGLTFYSYSPAQMVIAVTIVLLFISDFKYHWQNRRLVAPALLLGLFLVLPYIRFQVLHPGETMRQLQLVNSYWIQDITTAQKLAHFFGEYLRGLNPLYWYDPIPQGLERHIMLGYGYLWRPGLPFVLAGLVIALWRIRQPAYRVVLIALLAAPSGAALAHIGITRVMFMVIPAAILAGLGFSWLLDWLTKTAQPRFPRLPVYGFVSISVFLLLVWASFFMLKDALRNGPTWFENYGMHGMQYGARQLFSEVGDYLREHPEAKLIVSPTWGNGTDVIARFFFADPLPFAMGNIVGYIEDYQPIGEQDVFVMTPEEMEQAVQSGKFTGLQVERTLQYPNGQDGFFFTRLRYVDDIQQVMAEELEQRRILLEELVALPGNEQARVRFSVLDMGSIQHAFDGDPDTLIRTQGANPMRVILKFDKPRRLSEAVVRVGGVPTLVEVLLFSGGVQQRIFAAEVEESPNPRDVRLDFEETVAADEIEVRVTSVRDGEPAHIHVWEISLW